jgi:hypothetical protein
MREWRIDAAAYSQAIRDRPGGTNDYQNMDNLEDSARRILWLDAMVAGADQQLQDIILLGPRAGLGMASGGADFVINGIDYMAGNITFNDMVLNSVPGTELIGVGRRVANATEGLADAARAERAGRNGGGGHVPNPNIFDDLARAATRNPDSKVAVIGKFAEGGRSYTKVAAHFKASYFKADNWNALTARYSTEELWSINESFLKQQIRQGKQIILSHDPSKATGFFEREVKYLRNLGYKFERNNWTWKAVR